jgi:hypothetical protein
MGVCERIAERQVARLDVPHRRIFIAVHQGLVIGIRDRVPAAQLLRLHQPAHEGLGLLPDWREIEDRMADRVEQVEAPLRPRRVHCLVGDLGDLRKISFGQPEDTFGIVGA